MSNVSLGWAEVEIRVKIGMCVKPNWIRYSLARIAECNRGGFAFVAFDGSFFWIIMLGG